MALRDEILSAPDLAREVVRVPEWGREVEVRELSALDLLEWEEEDEAAPAGARGRLFSIGRLLVRSLHDPASGARIFEAGDVDGLVRKNPRVLVRLFEVAARVCSLGGGAGDGLTGK